jgi:hypothetical protein
MFLSKDLSGKPISVHKYSDLLVPFSTPIEIYHKMRVLNTGLTRGKHEIKKSDFLFFRHMVLLHAFFNQQALAVEHITLIVSDH